MRSRSTDPWPVARCDHRPGAHSDRGSVTAETALALPAVVLVLAALLGTGRVLMAQLSCVDAARAGARAAARAEPDARVRAAVGLLAPAAGPVLVHRGGGLVRVEVSARVSLPLPVPAVPLHCVAVSAAESAGPTASEPAGPEEPA